MEADALYHASPAETVPANPGPAGPGWTRLRLRRDGQRPLIFQGMLIMEMNCRSQPDDLMSVALYTDDAGSLFAAASCHPGLHVAALPVHRSRKVSSAGDYADFLAECRPAACLCPHPARQTEETPPIHDIVLAMQSAFDRMIQDCFIPCQPSI